MPRKSVSPLCGFFSLCLYVSQTHSLSEYFPFSHSHFVRSPLSLGEEVGLHQKRLLLVYYWVCVFVIQWLALKLVSTIKKKITWSYGFEAESSVPADKECCCLHFAFISSKVRPSSLNESEICCCSAPCFKAVAPSDFFYGSGKKPGPYPTVKHTMSTNLPLLYSIFGLAVTGGQGRSLMANMFNMYSLN